MHSCQPVGIIHILSVFGLSSTSVFVGTKKFISISIPLIGSKNTCLVDHSVLAAMVFVKVMIRENYIKFTITYK